MSNKQTNPANNVKQDRSERTRVPMSLPLQKLAVPEIPGYHLHWIMGSPSRIAQAIKGGYEFVNDDEVDVVNTGLANDPRESGNTDMGSRVSVIAGSDTGEDGREQRLYLMKIKEEWWQEDQELLAQRNEQVAAAIRGGRHVGANPHSRGPDDNLYVPEAHQKAVANLFTPKRRT